MPPTTTMETHTGALSLRSLRTDGCWHVAFRLHFALSVQELMEWAARGHADGDARTRRRSILVIEETFDLGRRICVFDAILVVLRD